MRSKKYIFVLCEDTMFDWDLNGFESEAGQRASVGVFLYRWVQQGHTICCSCGEYKYVLHCTFQCIRQKATSHFAAVWIRVQVVSKMF